VTTTAPLFNHGTHNGGGYRDVQVRDVAAYGNQVRLIDVREPSEFQDGHIAGAELVPLATVAASARTWPREAPLVVVCRSGGRSSNASRQLAALGFSQVMNMAGGMLAWDGAGLPIERGLPRRG